MYLNKVLSIAAVAACMASSAFAQADRITAGSEISVRTVDSIQAKKDDAGKIYSATVDKDVLDSSGRVAIPRGSNAELTVRQLEGNQLSVDLDAVQVSGRRYSLGSSAQVEAGGGREGVGKNKRTAKYLGGGAVVGSIIGAIAGGGKGAAIGAATGAGAGAVAQTVTKGSSVNVPSETLLTFRMDRPLVLSKTGRAVDSEERSRRREERQNRQRDRALEPSTPSQP